MNVFTAFTKIRSALLNENFEGLASGEFDETGNSSVKTRKEALADFVASGLTIPTSANLSTTIAIGEAYINGEYVPTSNTVHAFTASKDTYVDLKDDGSFVYVEVANGATAGMTLSVNADSTPALRIAKVVTSGAAITSVSQTGMDPIGNVLYNLSASNISMGAINAAATAQDITTAAFADVTNINGVFSSQRGRTLEITVEISYYRKTSGQVSNFLLLIDGVTAAPDATGWSHYTNELLSHKFFSRTTRVYGIAAGTHTIKLQAKAITSGTTSFDTNDITTVTVRELL